MAGAVQTKGRSAALIEVLVDCSLQTSDGVEAATPYPLAREGGEERFDRIQPGAGCRREVEGPARMPREPGLHLWMLMGGVVVDDSLNNPAGWHCALDGIEKADELLMAEMSPAAFGS